MNIYLRISERIDINKLNLTSTEETIFEYVFQNINNIEVISVSKIAESCHCSTAAIHRFVAKFDCNGYKQFKAEIVSGKKMTKFSNSTFQLQMIEMASYIQSLDITEFKDNLLNYENKRVYVYGVGGSYVSAQYFIRQLNRFKIDASAYRLSDREGLMDHADAVVFLSHSGQTNNIIDKAISTKANQIPTFALTKDGSKLADIVDFAICHNDKFNSDNYNQKESQLATIMLIEKIFYDLN